MKILLIVVVLLVILIGSLFAGTQQTTIVDGSDNAIGTTANPLYVEGV